MQIQSLVANIALLTFNMAAASAQIVAIQTANGAGSVYGIPAANHGWTFTIGGASISVSDLGYFDYQTDGLFDSHPVGIWDADGTLLRQGLVPAGTTGTLIGSYRFISVAPVTLEANETYYIGGFSPANADPVIEFSSETFASAIAYVTATTSEGTQLARPDTVFNGARQGIFGPNFVFSPTPVPEPHEYALLFGFGLTAFYLARTRLRTRKQQIDR